MKKVLIIAAVLCASLSLAVAGLDAYDSVTVKVLSQPLNVADASVTNAAVDIAAAKGTANLLLWIAPAHTNAGAYTNTVTFQTSTASAGTYTTVTSATSVANSGTGAVTSIKVDVSGLSRYVRTIQKVNDGGSAGAVLIYPK